MMMGSLIQHEKRRNRLCTSGLGVFFGIRGSMLVFGASGADGCLFAAGL
jgi:hypothetical protein